MANLGNAWHIPGSPEPRGRGAMRDPVGALVPGTAISIFNGNQYQGAGGNPGNQLQAGSSVFFKRKVDAAWTELPMLFQSAADNNKFYAATIPAGTFQTGDVVQYYLRIPYSDHDTTFLMASGPTSVPTADENAARAAPFTFTLEASATRGQWGPVFTLRNVAIHAHLLPNSLVLMWGRRDKATDTLDEHACTPFLWDPSTNQMTNTPKLTTVNLFCSGHTFLPDGRMLVAGGHFLDSQGLDQASIYDPASNTWTPTARMNNGRWYPTATTLPDGRVLVTSGSFLQNGTTPNNPIPQIWNNGAWTSVDTLPNASFALYPRMHVTSAGRVFMSGSLAQSWSLDPSTGGHWATVAQRNQGARDYAPSVMYDVDKVIYIGGGNNAGSQQPTAAVEIIDLRAAQPTWHPTNPMHFPRRQHNATLLPDGTVLVTGGTRGGGGPTPGFNDLGPGQPVHVAELWDPATGQWTELAAEQVDRCYHATAVLLPDATVLSAGGGEFKPTAQNIPNDPLDSHRDGQIFSPPYLFKGPRPVITTAPTSVNLGDVFQVATAQANDIGKVTFVRLSSVTHSFNMNQHINFLPFKAAGGGLTITAPSSPNECPPGHYLLFLISKPGAPSVAKIVQVKRPPSPSSQAAGAQAQVVRASAASRLEAPPDAFALRAAVVAAAQGPPVVVGLLGTCPYGIGACWGGAHEALATLEGVQAVDPIPDGENSTADVFLEDERLPALDRWIDEFRQVVNGSYWLRGIEMTLEGTIALRGGDLFLEGAGQRPPVQLVPIAASDKIQWNNAAGSPRPLEPQEAGAFQRLAAGLSNLATGQQVTVTGPLKHTDAGYRLEVRLFNV